MVALSVLMSVLISGLVFGAAPAAASGTTVSVRGTVLDDVTSDVIAGATVTAYRSGQYDSELVATVTSDESGTFDLQLAPSTTYILKASHPTRVPIVADSSLSVLVGTTSLFGQRLRMKPGNVRGSVTSPTGTPLAGAVVSIYDPMSYDPSAYASATETRSDGTFVLHAPAGSYEVVASPPADHPELLADSAPEPVAITGSGATLSEVTGLTVALRQPSLRGVVTTALTGEPLADAFLFIQGNEAANESFFQSTTTNAEGAYAVRVSLAGDYRVTAYPRGDDPAIGVATSRVFTVTDPDQVVAADIRLDAPSVYGTVVIEGTTTPVEQGWVSFTPDGGGYGDAVNVFTSTTGDFAASLDPGDYAVRIYASSVPNYEAVETEFDWTLDDTVAMPVTFEMFRPTIRGSVTTAASGNEVEGAEVLALTTDSGYSTYLRGGVDDDGRFGFRGERGTSYRLVGVPPLENPSRLGSRGVTVTVPATGSVEAEIQLPSMGRPPYSVREFDDDRAACNAVNSGVVPDRLLDVSADGARLLVALCDPTDLQAPVQVVDRESGDVIREFPDVPADVVPAMSPDGSTVAWSEVADDSNATGLFDLAVADVASGDVRRIPASYPYFTSGSQLPVAVSGDGSVLAFVGRNPDGYDRQVVVCRVGDLDPGADCDSTARVDASFSGVYDLTLSETGSTVAFLRQQAELENEEPDQCQSGAWEITVADLFGDELVTTLSEPARLPTLGMSSDGTELAWLAPDCRTVEVRERNDAADALWLSRPDVRPLADERFPGGPFDPRLRQITLTDDGSTVFVTAAVNDLASQQDVPGFGLVTDVYPVPQLWKVPLDTGVAELVSRRSPEGLPLSGVLTYTGGVLDPQVSADGSVFAFVARVPATDDEFDSVDRLFVGTIDDTARYLFPDDAAITVRAGSTSAALSWPDVTAPGRRYRIDVSPPLGGERPITPSNEYLLQGLSPSTAYTVTVDSLALDDSVASSISTEFTTTAERSRLLTAQVSDGGTVTLSWESEPSVDHYTVVGTPADDALEPVGPVFADEIPFVVDGLPADSTWTFVVNGVVGDTPTVITDPVEVEIPELSIDTVTWTVPTTQGLARLDELMTVRLTGEAGRRARAVVTHVRSGETAMVTSDVALDETAPGVYTGEFTVAGSSRIVGVRGFVEDGTGGSATATASRLGVPVEGILDVVLTGPVKSGWTVSVRSAGSVVARRAIGGAGPQTVTVAALRALDDVTVEVLDPLGGLVTTISGGEPIAVAPGRRTVVTGDVPSLVDVEIELVDQDDAPIGDTRLSASYDGVVVDLWTGADGRSRLPSVVEGAEVTITASGLPVGTWSSSPVTVTAAAPTTTARVVATRRPVTAVVGNVVDIVGRPVPAVSVQVRQTVDGDVVWLSAVTDADGEFVVEGVLADVAAVISVFSFGRGNLTVDHTPAVGGDPLEFVFRDPVPYEIPIQLIPYGSVSPVSLDWRTAVHFGFSALVGGRRVWASNFLDREPGSTVDRLVVAGQEGELLRICFDGAEARQGWACGEVTLPAIGQDIETLVIQLPRRVNVSANVCVGVPFPDNDPVDDPCPAGSDPFLESSVRVSTQSSNAATATAWGYGGSFVLPLADGDYDIVVESSRGRVLRAFRSITIDEESPIDVVLDPIVLSPSFRFGGDGNRIVPDRPIVPSGGNVEFRASWSNSGERLEDVSARITVPTGVQLVPSSVMVGTEAIADSDLVVSDDTGGRRSVVVPLGDIAPNGTGALRYRLRPVDPSVNVLTGAVSIEWSTTTESLPSTTVRVIGVTLSAPAQTSSRAFTVRGRGPAGASVDVVLDGAVVGQGTVTSAGTWSAAVALPERPDGTTFVLTARTSGTDTSVTSRPTAVLYDASSAAATDVCIRQKDPARTDGRRFCFDPRRGVAGFPFVFVPGQVLEVEVFVDQPDRVEEITVWIGAESATAERRDVPAPAAGPSVTTSQSSGGGFAFVAEFTSSVIRGDLAIDIVSLPPRPTVPVPPADRSQLDPYLVEAFVGAAASEPSVTTWTDEEFVVENTVDLPAFGDDGDIDVEVRLRPTDEPSQAERAEMERTGSLAWDVTVSDPVEVVEGGVTRLVSNVTFKVAVDDLPDGAGFPVPPSGAVSGRSISASAALVKALDVGFKVITNAEAGYQAVNGGGKYDDIGALFGTVSDCVPEPFRGNLINRSNTLLSDAARYDVNNSAIALGTALIPANPLAGAAIWGVTFAMGKRDDINISVRTKSLAKQIRESNELWTQPHLCPDPEKRAPKEKDSTGAKDPESSSGGKNRVASPVWIYDPSGYTFEGVPSNRITGVTATLLTAPPLPDDTCVDNLPWRFVDMDPYGQTNPLITDEDGRYAWDVPEGCWKVQFTKDGYQTAYSAALKVLPPHLDVNIALVAFGSPEVESTTYADGSVDVTFSRPMELSSAEAIALQNGRTSISAAVEPVDAEADLTGRELARTFRITPETALTPGNLYEVGVSTDAVDYAQRPLESDVQYPVANVPAAPIVVSAVPDVGSVAITWSEPADGGSPITSYDVSVVGGGSGGDDGCSTEGALTCTVTGLASGVSYSFVVTASNAVGTSPESAPSDPVTTPSVPGAPTGVTVTGGDASVVVAWTAPADDGGDDITGFEARAWSAASGGAIVETCTSSRFDTCTIVGLANGTTYHVDVIAVNDVGPSSPSTPRRSVTPLGTLSPSPTPTIVGTARVGSTLSVTTGTWGPEPVSVSRQWLRNGSPISGATATTYRVAAADRGARLSVRVTASKDGYASATRTSAETADVAAGTLSPAPTPTISGRAKVRSTLTAKAGTWGPAPVKLTYQWLRNGAAIRGATTSRYKLVTADRGKRISVRVTGSKAGYTTLSMTSKTTAAVKK